MTLEPEGGAHLYETSNDLPPTTRRSAIDVLNEHLADAIDLQLQAKQAHWNIKGPHFIGLHELFDRVAPQAGEYSDRISRGVDKSLWMVEAHVQNAAMDATHVEKAPAVREPSRP